LLVHGDQYDVIPAQELLVFFFAWAYINPDSIRSGCQDAAFYEILLFIEVKDGRNFFCAIACRIS